MAAAVDGTILIDSHIVTDGLNSDLAAVESRLRQMASKTRRAGGKMAREATGNAEYDDLTRQLTAAEKEADRLQKKFDALVDKEERFIATGGDINSKTFKGYEYDIEKTTQAMAENEAKAAELRDRISEMSTAMSQASASEGQEASAADQLRDAVQGVANETENAASKTKELGSRTKTTANGFKGLLRTVLKYGLGIRSVYILFRKARQAFVEGFKNLAQVDNQTNASISTLKSSLSQLKNSFAAAFAPVLNAVAPILNKLIQMLVTAANYIGMFFAALSGASTYRPAIYAYESYAESLGSTADAAADAAKNLSGLDEMNIWQSNSSGGGGGGGGTSPSDMFGDEEAIPNSVANIAEKVKAIFEAVYNAVAPVLESLWNLLVFEADDVLFNWSNLSSEDILEKIVAGLGLVLGAIAGFSITHSLTGLVIGAVIGLALTLLLDGVVFNDDGKISGKEITKLLAGALTGLAGAAIGFSLGGIKGAAIGAVIGLALTVLIQAIKIDSDPVKNANIKNLLQSALIAASGGVLGFMVGGGVGAVIGVTIGLAVSSLTWETVNVYELNDAQKELVNSAKAISDAYASASAELSNNTSLINRNFDRVNALNEELRTLCDENGNITQGYENRVDYILGELNAALGTEYERNGDIIEQYQQMQGEIDKIIEKRKAEALLDAWGGDYANALRGVESFRSGEKQTELRDSEKMRDEKLQDFIDAVNSTSNGTDVFTPWMENIVAAGGSLDDAVQNMIDVLGSGEGIESVSQAGAAYQEAAGAVYNLEETAKGYYATVDRCEKAQMAMLEGDYDTATKILSSYSAYRWADMEKNHRYTQQELADLKSDLESSAWYAAWYKEHFEAGIEGFTAAGLEEAQAATGELAEIWKNAGADAKEYAAFYKKQFESGVDGFTAKGLFEAKVAAGDLKKTWTDAAGEARAYAAWYKEQFEAGIEGFTAAGLAEAQNAANGLHSTWKQAASDAETDGKNVGEGYAKGIRDKIEDIKAASRAAAQASLNELKNVPVIKSPAHIPREYGQYISEGYALGVADNAYMAEDAASDVANSVLGRMAASFSGVRLPHSDVAAGCVIPTAAALGASSSSGVDLKGLLRDVLSEFFGAKTSRSTSVSAKVNNRTLFDVLIEEGKQRMATSGRNPFVELALR